MKKSGLWLVCLLSGLCSAGAQVTVEVLQDQDQFLQGEALRAKVRITNRSGQTLHLGDTEDWVTFSVESRDGPPVTKLGDVPAAGAFTLDSSKMATKRVDLSPYFSLMQPGRYSITATVRIKDWERQITSPPRNFDIIEGARLWEQEFGVPNSSGSTNSSPEVRKYILQQANYLKTHLQLYLRVTDSPGSRVFRVYPIGPMVSFSNPEPQIDHSSNLHVLFQNGPHSFSYTVFDPDGGLLTRQTYGFSNSRPRLKVDAEGKISVAGGQRRVSSNDFPPPPATLPKETPPVVTPPEEPKPTKSSPD